MKVESTIAWRAKAISWRIRARPAKAGFASSSLSTEASPPQCGRELSDFEDWRALASDVYSVSAIHARARAATRPVKGPTDKQDRKNDCGSCQDEIAGKIPLSPGAERSYNGGGIGHVSLSFAI
jgi:hypothetical protein